MQFGGSANIHRKYGFGLHQLRNCSNAARHAPVDEGFHPSASIAAPAWLPVAGVLLELASPQAPAFVRESASPQVPAFVREPASPEVPAFVLELASPQAPASRAAEQAWDALAARDAPEVQVPDELAGPDVPPVQVPDGLPAPAPSALALLAAALAEPAEQLVWRFPVAEPPGQATAAAVLQEEVWPSPPFAVGPDSPTRTATDWYWQQPCSVVEPLTEEDGAPAGQPAQQGTAEDSRHRGHRYSSRDCTW
jgi:hypothetical protein